MGTEHGRRHGRGLGLTDLKGSVGVGMGIMDGDGRDGALQGMEPEDLWIRVQVCQCEGRRDDRPATTPQRRPGKGWAGKKKGSPPSK